VRTQIIQQLHKQQDLNDSFAKKIHESTKKESHEMHRLREMFDSAFTPEQFIIV